MNRTEPALGRGLNRVGKARTDRATRFIVAFGVLLLAVAGMWCLGDRQNPLPINGSLPPVRYRITDLGSPPGRFDYISARSINNRGQVVCGAAMSTGRCRLFLWERGRFRDLGAPEDGYTIGGAINNRGEVVGGCRINYPPDQTSHLVIFRDGKMELPGVLGAGSGINDKSQIAGDLAGYRSRAFLFDNGKTIELGTLGGHYSRASQINDRGEIVGSAQLPSNMEHAFLYSDGKMKDLGTLGGLKSSGYAINNKGWVVGLSYVGNDTTRPFLYRDGRMEGMENYPGAWSIPSAINSSGAVVGYAEGEHELMGALIWIDGHVYPLQDLVPPNSGWTLDIATGINDRGQIIVKGRRAGGRSIDSCLLTPVATCPKEIAGRLAAL